MLLLYWRGKIRASAGKREKSRREIPRSKQSSVTRNREVEHMSINPELGTHVAPVTGASRWIGAAIALALAEAGAAVAINYRQKAGEAEAVVAQVLNRGGRAMAVGADVSQSAQVTAMIECVAGC